MTTPKTEPDADADKAEGPLARVVDGVKLPAVKAGQIVNEIADQAPLYGLSGAILAVGLVTGRRALARTGASMLTSQIITALARAATDRILPAEDKTKTTTAPVEPTTAQPSPADEPAPVEDRPSTVKVAAGALLGVAAAVGGGWLLSRLLTRKPADEDQSKDEGGFAP
jgi:hypothetical protein